MYKNFKSKYFGGALLLLALVWPGSEFAMAQNASRELVQVKFATAGAVQYEYQQRTIALNTGDHFEVGGTIRTQGGQAVLELADGALLRVLPGSSLRISPNVVNGTRVPGAFETLFGRTRYEFLEASRSYQVQSGHAVAGAQGSILAAEVDKENNARFGVHQGKVAVSDEKGQKVDAQKGDGVLANEGVEGLKKVKLPRTPVAVSPSDAVGLNFNIEWNPVPSVTQYRVTIAQDKAMNAIVFEGVVEDSVGLAFDLFNAGTYFWTIESIDALGFASIPSSAVQFSVEQR